MRLTEAAAWTIMSISYSKYLIENDIISLIVMIASVTTLITTNDDNSNNSVQKQEVQQQ